MTDVQVAIDALARLWASSSNSQRNDIQIVGNLVQALAEASGGEPVRYLAMEAEEERRQRLATDLAGAVSILRLHNVTPAGSHRKCLDGCIACAFIQRIDL